MDNESSPTSLLQILRIHIVRVFLIATFLIFCTIGLGVYEIYTPHQRFSGSKSIEISSGLGSRMIGAKLKQEGFIRSKWMFVTYVLLRGDASLLKPGVYEFKHSAISKIAATLVKGSAHEITVTLPEGATINDLIQILNNQKLAAGTTFNRIAAPQNNSIFIQKYSFLKQAVSVSGLEGYLFPDTYHIFKAATAENIADIFLQNFDKKITPEIRNEIARSGKTLHDIIIMASLIEKEVVSDHDRAVVSGILWNRLRIGMALQVDATINYIKKQNSAIPLSNGKISLADLKLNSPYNTYKYRGLPAGPIGNPGLSAILAAIRPTPSTYIYYLSALDGQTIFSRTLEEHNKAKAKYLK